MEAPITNPCVINATPVMYPGPAFFTNWHMASLSHDIGSVFCPLLRSIGLSLPVEMKRGHFVNPKLHSVFSRSMNRAISSAAAGAWWISSP